MNRTWKAIRLAARNLALHKLRTGLTILGLIFGVSSVVAMLAIAEGASEEAQKQIADLGAMNIIIRSKKPIEDLKAAKGQNDNFIATYGLTRADHERIAETIPSVVSAIPLREFRQEARYRDRVLDGRVVGCNADCLKIINVSISQGRFLTDVDLGRFANIVVIGAEVAEELFPYGDPIGKSIRIGESHFYEIVGVTTKKAASAGAGSSMASQDFNRDLYIPMTTDRARFGELILTMKSGSFSAEKIELSQITVAVDGIPNVKRTSEALDSLLKQFHPRTDYSIMVPLELLEKAEATKRIFNLVLGSIAGISLLVGGIGIMNIMLATVTERTKEIGIRRALGAKRRDITFQFLVETVVMSGTGGLIGMLLGLAAPPLVARFSGIPVVVKPWSPILAFLIAIAIGVAFGVYPARRAARLDPVEALRSE